MPLQTIPVPHAPLHLAVWHITESEEELLQKGGDALAKSDDFKAIIPADKRREWLASRLLIAHVVEQQQLSYQGIVKDEYNKPSLIGLSQKISISHTKGLAAMAMSTNKRIGIDAEYLSPRIARIAPKFLHEQELTQAAGQWKELLAYWCAKEALYKLYGKKGLIFKEQIRVEKKLGDTLFQGTVVTSTETIKVSLNLQTTAKHMIVHAIEQ